MSEADVVLHPTRIWTVEVQQVHGALCRHERMMAEIMTGIKFETLMSSWD
jgi:hypothetical protein